MRPVSNRSLLLILIPGVLLLPLLVTALMGAFTPQSSTRDAIITTNYTKGQPGGTGDFVSGQAPPNMELAVYINDRLFGVTRAGDDGTYKLTGLPVLPQRRNTIVVLPTVLDASTLALLYDPFGFREITPPPADIVLTEPFLASATREADGVRLFGSVTPFTTLEIFADACENSNPHVTVAMGGQGDAPDPDNQLDEEGSFKAFLPLGDKPVTPARYCFKVTPQNDAAGAQTFDVAAPAQSHARGEGVWSRAVALQVSPSAMQVTFTVEMPVRTLIYQNLASGGISELQFIRYVFGEVKVNTFIDPRKVTWRQEKAADSERVKVIVESQPLEFLIPEDTATAFELDTSNLGLTSALPYTSNDTLTVTLDGVHMLKNDPPATSGDESTQEWRGTLNDAAQIKLWISRSPTPPADPIGRTRLINTVSSIVTQLNITPPPPLDESLEGQIVGILPVRVPAAWKAQVYDYFSTLYRADPYALETEHAQTFQSVLRDLPSLLPNWLTSLLFGAIWLIPAALILLALRKPATEFQTVRVALGRVAVGAIILTLLSLDWLTTFAPLGLQRDVYLAWLMAGYLTFLVLYLPLPRWTGWLFGHLGRLLPLTFFAAALAALTGHYLLIFVPDGYVTALLTGLPLLGFAFLAWHAYQTERAPSLSLAMAALAAIVGLSLPMQSLPLSTQLAGGLGISSAGVTLTRPLLALSILLGVTVALWRSFDRPLGAPLQPLERDLGRVLLVGFAVGLTPVWGFIPLAVLVAVLIFEWILPVELLAPASMVAEFIKNDHARGVENILRLNRTTHLWRNYETSVQKKARENEWNEAEYQQKREEYLKTKANLEEPGTKENSKLTLRDLAFNFGAGPLHSDNLVQALTWGLIFAIPLVVLQGWPLVSTQINSAEPFPFLSTGARLVMLTTQYLAGAIFLGYFFPYLRGRNGLEKGAWLGGAIAISFLPHYLIHANTGIEWMVVAIWDASMLAFILLISLLAFDIRTLLYFKLGLSRMQDLYDFGEILVYLTGTGAPLITTIFGAVTDRLNDWIPALLNVAFPNLTLSSDQFQLLQMLIDLAQRVTSGLFK